MYSSGVHGLSKAGTEWTYELVAYALDRFHRHHLRTPTLAELRVGIPDMPSFATIRRHYGSTTAMFLSHGYRARRRGAQPGNQRAMRRDADGRFLPG